MPGSKRKKGSHGSDESLDTTQKELLQKIERLENKIERISNANTQKLIDQMEFIQGNIHDLQVEQDNMKKDIPVTQLKDERSILVDEVESIRQCVTIARDELNELNQYSKRNNVRVFGIRDSSTESLEKSSDLVKNIIKIKLKLDLRDYDIDKAHRVGKYRPSSDRAIIVRFNSHSAAEKVLYNRRALKDSGITIMEDLTKTNVQTLVKVKELASTQQTWTRRGEIFAKNQNNQVFKLLLG
ncbi:hypothetical protein ElyMa_000881600 [Elysia marginata]|uniref:L1 transposable element RRM domain-containing protein n=1 Tax=Elysia marginata TaxID=1093978 RepID=A0AAV4H678_9GAST|nr:hypothetical protein ElyMa_000881600 [Elysia marginata]